MHHLLSHVQEAAILSLLVHHLLSHDREADILSLSVPCLLDPLRGQLEIHVFEGGDAIYAPRQ